MAGNNNSLIIIDFLSSIFRFLSSIMDIRTKLFCVSGHDSNSLSRSMSIQGRQLLDAEIHPRPEPNSSKEIQGFSNIRISITGMRSHVA